MAALDRPRHDRRRRTSFGSRWPVSSSASASSAGHLGLATAGRRRWLAGRSPAADRIEAAAGDGPSADRSSGVQVDRGLRLPARARRATRRRVDPARPRPADGPVPDPTAAAVVLCDTLFVEDLRRTRRDRRPCGALAGRARARAIGAARPGSDDLGLPSGNLTGGIATDDTDGKSERRPPQWAGVRDPRDPDVEGGIRADWRRWSVAAGRTPRWRSAGGADGPETGRPVDLT